VKRVAHSLLHALRITPPRFAVKCERAIDDVSDRRAGVWRDRRERRSGFRHRGEEHLVRRATIVHEVAAQQLEHHGSHWS